MGAKKKHSEFNAGRMRNVVSLPNSIFTGQGCLEGNVRSVLPTQGLQHAQVAGRGLDGAWLSIPHFE